MNAACADADAHADAAVLYSALMCYYSTSNSHNQADILIHTTLICGHTYFIVHFKLTLRASVRPTDRLQQHFTVSLAISFFSPMRSLAIHPRHFNHAHV